MDSQGNLPLEKSERLLQNLDKTNNAPEWFLVYMSEYEKLEEARFEKFKNEIITEIQNIKKLLSPLYGLDADQDQTAKEENVDEEIIPEETPEVGDEALEKAENDENGVEEVRAFLLELSEENFFQLPAKMRVWTQRSIYEVVDLFFEKAKSMPGLIDPLAFMVEPIIRVDPLILDCRKITRIRCQDSFIDHRHDEFVFIGKLYVAGLLSPEFIHESVLPLFESDVKKEIKGLCDLLKIVAIEDVFRYKFFYIYDYVFKMKRLAAKGLLVKTIMHTIDYILKKPSR